MSTGNYCSLCETYRLLVVESNKQLTATQQQILEQQLRLSTVHEQLCAKGLCSIANELISETEFEALQQHVNAEKVKMLEYLNTYSQSLELHKALRKMIAELTKPTGEE